MNRRTHKYLLALLIATGLFSACKDDEVNTPVITQITISENMTNDGGTVYKTEKFIYENSILISHSTTQTYGEQQSVSQTTTFAYSGNQATITYESGDVATYTLGADGYATQCTYRMGDQVRIYQFTYSDGYLTQVDEFINGVPFMSNTLTYDHGDLTSISFGEYDNKVACSTSETVNYGHLPFIKLVDFHPLSMHMDAMYAHLLGKPTQHMVSGYEPVITATDEESQESEKTTYQYQTDSQQRVTDVEEKTIYTGYVFDTDGNRHLTTSSASRKLAISYN